MSSEIEPPNDSLVREEWAAWREYRGNRFAPDDVKARWRAAFDALVENDDALRRWRELHYAE